ncbi:hypothetical protein A6770_32335 [Nostoc minutum NIES-26]|uniref:Bacterial conjugation TrbI-like protein n=1 Tax=Nostoc minutum NIES-26 TaxID=1844469 RepID=A0A367Q7I6_9NOSO|nr:hypothetical protein A6770_32335 [Nostoc minutum NIES-26]
MNENPLTVDEILNLDDERDEVDKNKIAEIDDTESLTQHTVITSPWSRLGIIGVPLGIGFLIFYSLFNNIINGQSSANNSSQNEQTQSAQSTPEPNNQSGDVYAQLALSKQQEQLDKIYQQKDKTAQLAQQKPIPELKPVAQQQKPVQVSSSPTTPKTYSSSSKNYSSPSRNYSSPFKNYSPPQRNLFAAQKLTSITAPDIDPTAELNRLRSMGSFGQITYANANAEIANDINSVASTDISVKDPQTNDEVILDENTVEADTVETSNGIEKIRPRWSSAKSLTKNYLPEENQIIQGRKTQYLTVGQFANGVLVTPLLKEPSTTRESKNSTADDGKRYVAKLTQDLKDNNAEIAIPSGTLLAIELVSVDGGNYAQAQVRSIIKDNTEYPIKAGAISVLGDGGNPLIARKFQDKGGEIAQYDLTVGLVSALGKVGEIINQPDTSEEIEDEFEGRIRRRSSGNRRNLGGALLEGAFGKLSSIVGDRASRSTEEILARSNVWYIPQGTKVTFLVNRTLELP